MTLSARRSLTIVAIATALLAGPVAASADEVEVPLAQGPGLDVVENNCNTCHSLDYIRTNAPFPTRAVWETEVTKMIKTYGAPIKEANTKAIIDYLATHYGS